MVPRIAGEKLQKGIQLAGRTHRLARLYVIYNTCTRTQCFAHKSCFLEGAECFVPLVQIHLSLRHLQRGYGYTRDSGKRLPSAGEGILLTDGAHVLHDEKNL